MPNVSYMMLYVYKIYIKEGIFEKKKSWSSLFFLQTHIVKFIILVQV